jgi:hypothetical protein
MYYQADIFRQQLNLAGIMLALNKNATLTES